MSKNIIELNGKLYDAITGKPLSRASQQASATLAKPAAAKTPAVRPRPSREHHVQAAKKAPARRLQPSKTLMRRAVNKPSQAKKPAIKAGYPLATKGANLVQPKHSVQQIDDARSKRAQAVHKSKLVTRFQPKTSSLHPLATKKAPVSQPLATTTHAPKKRAVRAPLDTFVQPVPVATPHGKQKVQKHTTHAKNNIFEQALANAKSHEQPAPKLKKRRSKAVRRFLSISAGVSALLLVAGFAAYMNKASIEMQVASVRAGFHASAPDYRPAGFERTATSAERGKVTISFVSPNDQRNFTLTQQESRWDSQTLYDSIIARSNTSYQTVQSHGHTIYLYDNTKAAWVDGGILYTVQGNANLDSDQIVSLANSI